MKAYADFATGKVSFAAPGTASATSASATGSSIAASTFSVTGSIAGDVLAGSAVVVLAGIFIFHRQKVVETEVPPENVPKGVN